MIYIIKTFFLIGAFLLTIGILELITATGIIIYRTHLTIFTEVEFHEYPTPRYVQVMEKLFFSGALLFFMGFLICLFAAHGIDKW